MQVSVKSGVRIVTKKNAAENLGQDLGRGPDRKSGSAEGEAVVLVLANEAGGVGAEVERELGGDRGHVIGGTLGGTSTEETVDLAAFVDVEVAEDAVDGMDDTTTDSAMIECKNGPKGRGRRAAHCCRYKRFCMLTDLSYNFVNNGRGDSKLNNY